MRKMAKFMHIFLPTRHFTQGSFIQSGDIIEGNIGGSTDILTRMTVKKNRGPGKVQMYR